MAQLSQTFSRKNWKTSFLNEDQKVELVIRLFSDDIKLTYGLQLTYDQKLNLISAQNLPKIQ